MRLIPLINRFRSGWLAALATTAVVALAAPGNAQTVPPPSASALSSADLAKVHLTAARNALSDVTQLPAAAQLTGETRTRVQQLITSFNDLIGKSDWRGPYAKVEASLSTLLGSETPPAPATATPSAVGTSGAAADLDPAIRAKLVEFRAHLDMFKTVASAAAPAPAAPPPAAAAPPPAARPPSPTAPPTPEPATTPPATPPSTMPPAPATPTAAATPPPTAPPAASPDPRPDAPSPADAGIEDRQDVSGVARDLLLHVEALEVILGAQARAQKEATAAAGGAVVSTETPSGSTRTTVTGPDVTLNGQLLEQIKMHLAEMRRLLEKK